MWCPEFYEIEPCCPCLLDLVSFPSWLSPSISHSHKAPWDTWENIFQNKFQSLFDPNHPTLCPALSTNVTTLSLFRLRFYNRPALQQGFPVLPPPAWVIMWCHSPRFMMLANVVSGMTVDRTSLRAGCEISHTVFHLPPSQSSVM